MDCRETGQLIRKLHRRLLYCIFLLGLSPFDISTALLLLGMLSGVGRGGEISRVLKRYDIDSVALHKMLVEIERELN